MPPKKDTFWEEQLRFQKAENPTWGAGRIQQALEQIAAKQGRDDAPKERWVGNEITKLKRDPRWPQKEKDYRTFRWPESMESGLLPWEASQPLLDFLERRGRPAEIGTERPTNRLAKWFWRLYQVAEPSDKPEGGPHGPTELERVEAMARQIAAHETSGGVPEWALRAVEGWLACHGWTADGEKHYNERVGQGVYPFL